MTRWIPVFLSGLIALAALMAQDVPPAADAPDSTPAVEPAPQAPPAKGGSEGGAEGTGGADAAAEPLPAPAAGMLGMPSGGNVAIIPVKGVIYDFTRSTLERRVDRALDAGASIIVLEIDTPGGVLPSALEISKYIKTIPAPTIAWINNEAYSAGILIASACDMIVMSPASATGDCAPIAPGQNLAPTERAKALSPLLEEFRDNAQQNGYDYTLFHAMSVLGVEVYLIEHKTTGERRVVNQLDHAVLVRDTEPESPAEEIPDGPRLSVANPAGPPPDLAQVGAVALEEPASAMPGEWKLITKVHDGTTLLTLNQTRAVEVGLAKGIVRNDAEIVKLVDAAGVMVVSQHWMEEIAFWLMHPVVRGLLLIMFLVCAFLEFQAPGIGVFGMLALVAIVALLGAPFMVGLAEAWHLVVVLLGLGLLILELTYLPGFGLIGVGGVVLMLIGLAFAAVPTDDTFGPAGGLPAQGMWGQAALSLLWMVLALAASLVAFFFLTKHFGQLPLFGRMVLRNAEPIPEGTPGPPVSGEESIGGGVIVVGDTGRATTELRPTGRAEIDGEMVDVISEGGWIDAGTPLRVIEVHGNRIVVDRA